MSNRFKFETAIDHIHTFSDRAVYVCRLIQIWLLFWLTETQNRRIVEVCAGFIQIIMGQLRLS